MGIVDLTPPQCLFDQMAVSKNATLTFPIAGDTTNSTTSATGNIIPATPQITSIEAICHFTKKPNDVNEQFHKGQDQKALWISGRCISPKSFPGGIGHLSEGTIVVNGRSGKCILYNPHMNPYVLDSLGEEFYAVFLEGEAST